MVGPVGYTDSSRSPETVCIPNLCIDVQKVANLMLRILKPLKMQRYSYVDARGGVSRYQYIVAEIISAS